ITVIGATPITSAVSSTDSPPKKRISTIRAFRASNTANSDRASSRARMSGSSAAGTSSAFSSETLRTGSPSRFGRLRAKSTRIRRISVAATPKKWARFSHRAFFQSIRRIKASLTRAVGWSVWPRRSRAIYRRAIRRSSACTSGVSSSSASSSPPFHFWSSSVTSFFSGSGIARSGSDQGRNTLKLSQMETREKFSEAMIAFRDPDRISYRRRCNDSVIKELRIMAHKESIQDKHLKGFIYGENFFWAVSSSVGYACRNKKEDVLLVQFFLNKIMDDIRSEIDADGAPSKMKIPKRLVPDGDFGGKTWGAIKWFQSEVISP